MRIKEFEKLIEEKEPQEIISMHTHNKIYLTGKQIDRLFREREKDYWGWGRKHSNRKEVLKNGKDN